MGSANDPKVWLLWVGSIVLLVLVVNFLLRRLLVKLDTVAQQTESVWDNAVLKAVRLPIQLMVWLGGVSLIVQGVDLFIYPLKFSLLQTIGSLLFIGIVAFFLMRFTFQVELALMDPQRLKPTDPGTAHAIGKLLRLTVLIATGLVVLQSMGFSISGVLAFGGVGGLAAGFAAKDLLSNFFGGFMIYFDKPFVSGDWIRSPDRQIEGTVEDISWRVTRIRTFEKRLLYIPNSMFASIVVENVSRMSHRKIQEIISIRYKDAPTIPAICTAVREMLKNHPSLDHDQAQLINFDSYGASSLNLKLLAYTRIIDWKEYKKVKESILLKIMHIVHEQGADFAASA